MPLKNNTSVSSQSWKARPTQKDVAQLAGVSQSVVSAVLRGDQTFVRYSDEIKLAVETAAKELHYRPNALARSMRNQRYLNIGLVVSNPGVVPYVPGLTFSGLLEEVARRGYFLSLIHDPTRKKGQELSDRLGMHALEAHVGGFILLNTGHLSEPLMRSLETARVPFVAHNASRSENCVVVDDFHAGEEATRHLMDQGYRNPCFIQSEPTDPKIRESAYNPRLAAYLKVMQEFQRPPLIYFIPRKSEDVAFEQLLMNHPRIDSLVCANDQIAVIALRTLLRTGRKPGVEIGIIGFNGEMIADLAPLPLTTLVIDWRSMGRVAVEMICQLIDDPGTPLPRREFQAVLRPAESTQR